LLEPCGEQFSTYNSYLQSVEDFTVLLLSLPAFKFMSLVIYMSSQIGYICKFVSSEMCRVFICVCVLMTLCIYCCFCWKHIFKL